MKTTKLKNQNSESGVTMLMTMLILGGLVIISITVGALGINELRASRAYVFSEPAIGAAQSGAENAVWAIKRSASISNNCTSAPNSSNLTATTAKGTYCNNTNTPVTLSVDSAKPITFYLYNPANPNGDISLTQMSPPYTFFTANFVSSTSSIGNVTVQVDKLSGSQIGTFIIDRGNTNQTLSIPTPVSNIDNRMAVTLTANSGTVTVQVNTNVGIPSFPTVQSTGCSGKNISSAQNCSSTSTEIYTRKLEVTVPQ